MQLKNYLLMITHTFLVHQVAGVLMQSDLNNAVKNGLNNRSRVVELASNDGYLLQYVDQLGIPCLGIEPTKATAEAARAKGIDTIEGFFGTKMAGELEKADLIVANNVLAHVPDINDFVEGIARLLKPQGSVSMSAHIYYV